MWTDQYTIDVYVYDGPVEQMPQHIHLSELSHVGMDGNIIAVMRKEDKIYGYAHGSIDNNDDRSCKITVMYNYYIYHKINDTHRRRIENILIEYCEDFFDKYTDNITNKNYYIVNSYRESYYDKYCTITTPDINEIIYAKPIYANLDNETYIFDTVDDNKKLNWLINNNLYKYKNLNIDQFIKYINATEYMTTSFIFKLLNNINDLIIFERVYCILSKKVYGLDHEETLQEILINNHLIISQMEQFDRNDVIDMYGLNDRDKYYLNCVNNIEIKTYNKSDLIKNIKSLLKYNDLICQRFNKIIVTKKIFDILHNNIWFLCNYKTFTHCCIHKLNEFAILHYDLLPINDIVAENQWLISLY